MLGLADYVRLIVCKKICNLFTRSTEEFTTTRLKTSVHSRIELEFGNVGF